MLGNRFACVKRPPQRGRDCLQMTIGRLPSRRQEQADAGDAGSPGPNDVRGSGDRHASNRKHRYALADAARGRQLVERGERMFRIL